MIINIPRDQLFPHADNPRKNLGDLTELTDSIRANGILQNLTIVPRDMQTWNSLMKHHGNIPDAANNYKDGYTVVIGHRRLAAGDLAELTEYPCSISDMDERAQIGTMLLENMQRNDLTPLEEAQGFQMMLALGETAKTIAQKTGFSETTIRKRLFVASLDAKKSASAYERGATLEDYMKLQRLTDEKKRNKVLESLGTHNFDNNLRNAIAEELRDRVAPEIIKQIAAFAQPTDKQSYELRGYVYHAQCDYEDYEKKKKLSIKSPKKWKADEYLYHVSLYRIDIYKKSEDFKVEKKMAELSPKEQEERREKRRKYKALKEMGETTYQLRRAFVTSFSQKPALDAVQLEALSEFAFASVCLGERTAFDYFAALEGLEAEKTYLLNYSQKWEAVKEAKVPTARILLASLYCTFRDNGESTYFHGTESSAEMRGYYKENKKLDAIYGCLCALGYKMSDDELALKYGIHAMFASAANGKK